MDNGKIADTLDHLADLLEFEGANAFRIRGYRNGSRAIREHRESIAVMAADDPSRLTTIDGVGKGVAEKCLTLLETGQLPQLEQLRERIPDSVRDLLRIPGLGPRKAAVLFHELGIRTMDQLREACVAQQVRGLKGFGARTEQTILSGIKAAPAAGRRIYWAAAQKISEAILAHLRPCPSLRQIEMAGSFRRGRETVGDLDILVVSDDVAEIMTAFESLPQRADVLARGETKMSIRTHDGLQIDLRVVPERSFGAALQYFTGSKDHNVELRGRARQRGLKINEYGVFRVADDQETYVAGRTEEEVYATLDLPCFPPEMREARREFEWAEAGELPTLIEAHDIQGDLHMHTTATDGKGTLDEMVAAARDRGLKYIAITDHSKRVSMAGGLDPERARQQWAAIDQLNQTLDGEFLVLKGIECDILENGEMDLPDEVLAEADWVLASVHYGQRQPRQQITDRIVGAIAHPHVSAIAHPTGRLLNKREAYDVDMEAVFQAAAEHRKMLELNANPARLDLHDIHCATAQQLGIPIVINTDAHSTQGLAVLNYGILQARRGGLTKSDVANTGTWLELRARFFV